MSREFMQITGKLRGERLVDPDGNAVLVLHDFVADDGSTFNLGMMQPTFVAVPAPKDSPLVSASGVKLAG